jgi:hypothetical protein
MAMPPITQPEGRYNLTFDHQIPDDRSPIVFIQYRDAKVLVNTSSRHERITPTANRILALGAVGCRLEEMPAKLATVGIDMDYAGMEQRRSRLFRQLRTPDEDNRSAASWPHAIQIAFDRGYFVPVEPSKLRPPEAQFMPIIRTLAVAAKGLTPISTARMLGLEDVAALEDAMSGIRQVLHTRTDAESMFMANLIGYNQQIN